jgi:hypothetical protein
VPHKAFQGTARPAHYRMFPSHMSFMADVIHDENNFKADMLQTLLYNQSYAYARSATAVSLRTILYDPY